MSDSARLAGLAIDRHYADVTLAKSQSMIESIRQVQMHFITEPDPRKAFDALLKVLLNLTESQYGFIGEILYESNGVPYLKTYAITNIAWNEETNKFFKENAPQGLEFRNLNSLFGAVMTSRQPVYANDPANDPRAGGLPPGHPAMHAFAGLPFFNGKELIGMVGIVNRPNGYDEKISHWLEPFLATCSNLTAGYRSYRQRLQAEFQVVQARDQLEATLLAIPDLLFEVDEQVLAGLKNRGKSVKKYGAE